MPSIRLMWSSVSSGWTSRREARTSPTITKVQKKYIWWWMARARWLPVEERTASRAVIPLRRATHITSARIARLVSITRINREPRHISWPYVLGCLYPSRKNSKGSAFALNLSATAGAEISRGRWVDEPAKFQSADLHEIGGGRAIIDSNCCP